MEAPVEIRISGDDIVELKRIGARVEEFLSEIPFTRFIHHDYYNDSCIVDVNVNDELANRLGITNDSVSKLVAGAFDGGPVSTFWEGDRAVTILLRLDQASRSSFADVRDAYVPSQVTQARVPLRAIAALEPEWQYSRIVRRNGVRTLTVPQFCDGRALRLGNPQPGSAPDRQHATSPPGLPDRIRGGTGQPDGDRAADGGCLRHERRRHLPDDARPVPADIGHPHRHGVHTAGAARRDSGAPHHPGIRLDSRRWWG